MNNYQPKVLAFAGSTRAASINKKLVRIAAAGAEQAGAQVTVVDLHDYPMPIYDGDIETSAGVPEKAVELRRLLHEHQGLLLASPEYNGSISSLLKNAIDWTSRSVNGEDGLAPYRNKVAVLMSASPGSYGGLRGLVHVRAILGNIGMIVLPNQLAIGKAHQAFAPDGSMSDPAQQEAVQALGRTLATTLAKLHGDPLCQASPERRQDAGRIHQ